MLITDSQRMLFYIIKSWPVQRAVTSPRQRAHSNQNQCLLKSEDTSSTSSLPLCLPHKNHQLPGLILAEAALLEGFYSN